MSNRERAWTAEQVADIADHFANVDGWYADQASEMLRAYAATLRRQGEQAGGADGCIASFEDFFEADANDPSMERELEIWEAAWKAALAQNAPETIYADHEAMLATLEAGRDDAAVDRFAAALTAKLAEARAKGRGGWNNDEPGMQQRLSDMLRAHVEKGDPRDVANFCMFLHQRGESILPAQTSCDLQPPNDYNRGYSAGWDAAKANAERARVPDAWRETIQEAIDCIADVERFKGNLKIGVYRHIGEKLNTLLAAAPSQPEDAA